jgi:aminoglycoside 3-N-acetyltransferase
LKESLNTDLAGDVPRHRGTLADDLRKIGVRSNDIILLHTSLRQVGFVVGGATALIQAILDVLGPRGTLVVPSQTPLNKDPSRWTDPALPESWWPTVREYLPAFDPELTPSEAVGIVPERVRTWPGAVRSTHPQTSFCAIGPRAAEIVGDHPLESQLGEESPLSRLAKCDANVLLIGVGYDRCTAFHLAEYRLPEPPTRQNSCAVLEDGVRRWITYSAIALDDSDFADLGEDFECQTGLVTKGFVGRARSRIFPVREAVDFAVGWFSLHRKP